MEFFTEPTVLEKATDPNMLADRVPGMRDSLDAAQELRQFYRETGQLETMIKNGWKHVASVQGSTMAIAEILDPELLRDKKRAFAWLDSHPEFLTYDRRAAMARTASAFHGWRKDE